MKKGNVLLIVLYMLCTHVFASGCFSFDDANIGTAAVKENAIDLNRGVGQYFEHWISVNGSPSILSNGALGSANFIAASGTQGLLMAACGADNSEGAAYGYGFQQGRSYSVIFKHRMIRVDNSTTPAIDSFNLILANGLVHNNQGGCGATVAVPSGSQYVYNSPNYNDTTWRADTIYIHSLTSSYTYLWFRINITQGMSDASFLVLDDLCVSDVTNTGINEVDRSADLTIYPDPATDHITITTGTALHDYMLQVVNISGQVLYPVVERSERGLLRIDVSSLQSGTYILHIRSAEGTMTKRFVVLK